MNYDTWLCVFDFLCVKDVVKCMRLSKTIYEVCNSNVIWKKLFINDFNVDKINGAIYGGLGVVQMALNMRHTYIEKYKLCHNLSIMIKFNYDYSNNNRTKYGLESIFY